MHIGQRPGPRLDLGWGLAADIPVIARRIHIGFRVFTQHDLHADCTPCFLLGSEALCHHPPQHFPFQFSLSDLRSPLSEFDI